MHAQTNLLLTYGDNIVSRLKKIGRGTAQLEDINRLSKKTPENLDCIIEKKVINALYTKESNCTEYTRSHLQRVRLPRTLDCN